MFECEFGTFINEYGHKEKYVLKKLSSRMTGHLHKNSPFETDNSCGNCDGAYCDICKEMYMVSKYGVPVTTKEGYEKQSIEKSVIFYNKTQALEYYMNL